jgi:cytochrome P450
MKEMIRDRAQNYEEHDDLFSNLMAANANDDEGLKLTNQEVAANIFIFLIGMIDDNPLIYAYTDMKFSHSWT